MDPLVPDSRYNLYRIHQVPCKRYFVPIPIGPCLIEQECDCITYKKLLASHKTGIFAQKGESRSGRRPLLLKEAHHIRRVNLRKIILFCHNFFACLEDYVLFVLTLDLIENALVLFYVCPWDVGPYVFKYAMTK